MLKQVKDRWLAKLFTRYPILVRRWAQQADIATFSNTPWTPFKKKIDASRIALITTGGVHLTSQPPFDMLNPSGDASYREIPADTSTDQLLISHNYYDHSDADRDVNIIFPVERLSRLVELGEIGSVNRRHFSFMGHISGNLLDELVKQSTPRVIDALVEDAVDAVLLTPAWGLCNQSVGLTQRAVEAAGIPTISISLSKEVTGKVKPPRAVYTGLPLGHPLGFPGAEAQQLQLLRQILGYLETIDSPGHLVVLDPTDSNESGVQIGSQNNWITMDILINAIIM